MNVKNRAVIRRLSLKTLWASRKRNAIAVVAIVLTSLLFTALFTIAFSVNEGFQQSNFRQVGGFSHGGFKYLSEEQFLELREDPLIKEWGLRRFLGMPVEEPFQKNHVELGYSDPNQAHWMFCDPIEGRLPQEGTKEAATDLQVLELLGVTPELGAPFTVTFLVDGIKTTQDFTLSGWWEHDPVVMANHILLPESRVNAVLAEVGVDPAQSRDGMTGSWNLDVMLESSLHIENDLLEILANHDYEEGPLHGNFISIGVNWGYSGAQLFENMDFATILAAAAALILIVFTGYLIIYNIFRISVSGDIRFYGLLKTIGTTPRQLRRIIRHQAILLSVCGIPVGLMLGWLVGLLLTPVVIRQLNGVMETVSADPVIFLGAALFSLVTVLISCAKPGRIAGSVSPVEAIRYTEPATGKRQKNRAARSVSPRSFAWSNLGRSPGKTFLTILSLSLAVVVLNVTVLFTDGFDMDKYLRDVPADFIVADTSYFQVNRLYDPNHALPEETIAQLSEYGGVRNVGRTYGQAFSAQEFVTEDWFRTTNGRWTDEANLDRLVEQAKWAENGLLADNVRLFGMEPAMFDRLTVLEGDLSKVRQPGSRYIAASYSVDDYGKPDWNSHWAKIGDTVTIRYVEKYEYYHPDTGEVYGPEVDMRTVVWARRAAQYRDVTYTVAALVDIPHALSYRYYGTDEFVLNDETFRFDSGTANVMYLAFDMEDGAAVENMEQYLAVSTEHSELDYESKETYVKTFQGFQNMFRILGGALSFIVGLIGALNFFNTLMTGIVVRRREFAVLQAVGMTGQQLKTMLIWEGFLYAFASAGTALILVSVLTPVVIPVLERTYWFFSGQFTLTPVLLVFPWFCLLGWILPVIMYRHMLRQSVVQRLQDTATG